VHMFASKRERQVSSSSAILIRGGNGDDAAAAKTTNSSNTNNGNSNSNSSNDNNNGTPSYDQRLEMCRLAFQGIPKVTVSDAERRCLEGALALSSSSVPSSSSSQPPATKTRTGTADLLDMLKAEAEAKAESSCVDVDFCLALGTDTFQDLTAWKWRRARDVVSHVEGRIYVIHRQQQPQLEQQQTQTQLLEQQQTQLEQQQLLFDKIDAVNREFGNANNNNTIRDGPGTAPAPAQLLHIPNLSAVSSTLVRDIHNETALSEYLHPSVVQYIVQHKLYKFSSSTAL
jgi:nicotinic acid mononucleotide adenylyltransferase